jgi:hypothetical protein
MVKYIAQGQVFLTEVCLCSKLCEKRLPLDELTMSEGFNYYPYTTTTNQVAF